MRKLKLQMQISVDGFVGGPKGELDWMTWSWDEEIKKYVADLTEPVDQIIMGRKLAEGFIPYWTNALTQAEPNARGASAATNETNIFAKKMCETPKIVFTKSLKSSDAQVSEWENTKIENGSFKDAIEELKQQAGGDIIAYGGSHFVSNLIRENLIDEFHLFVNPVAIGNGITIFKERIDLKLIGTCTFPCGITAFHYQSK